MKIFIYIFLIRFMVLGMYDINLFFIRISKENFFFWIKGGWEEDFDF